MTMHPMWAQQQQAFVAQQAQFGAGVPTLSGGGVPPIAGSPWLAMGCQPPSTTVDAFIVYNSPQAPAGNAGTKGAQGTPGTHSVVTLPGTPGGPGPQGAPGARSVEVHVGCPGAPGACGDRGAAHPRAAQLAAQGVPKVTLPVAALAGGANVATTVLAAARAAGIQPSAANSAACRNGGAPAPYAHVGSHSKVDECYSRRVQAGATCGAAARRVGAGSRVPWMSGAGAMPRSGAELLDC